MLINYLTAALCLAGAVSGLPLTRRQDRGSYTVNGLGSRKQAILSAGGNTLDLAIAMLETENMQTNYAYGQSPRARSFNPRLSPKLLLTIY